AALRTTVAMDPNKTIASITEQPPTKPAPNMSVTSAHPPVAQETNFGASLEAMAGTVSGAQLDKALDERERREKEHQDKRERLALQAKELEDRLERLSGSMPPSLDPETTRVQGSSTNPEWAASTGGEAVSPRRAMVVDITPKRKGPPTLLLISAAVLVMILGGVGIGAYLMLRSNGVTPTPTPTPTPVPTQKAKADL